MAEDITERLERTFEVLKSRSAGVHASYVREGIQEIFALREKVACFEQAVKVPDREEPPFSHSEEKGNPLDNLD